MTEPSPTWEERRDALALRLHAEHCFDGCDLPVVFSPPFQPSGWQEWAAAEMDAEEDT